MQHLPRAPGDTAYSGDSAAILHFLLHINGMIIEPCIHLAAFKALSLGALFWLKTAFRNV